MFNKTVYLLIALFLIGLGINVAMGYTWYSRIYAVTFSYGEYKEIVGVLFAACGLPFIYWAFRSKEGNEEEND